MILEPYEMAVNREPYMMKPTALGVLMRLLPYMLMGSGARRDAKLSTLASFANVSTRVLKRHWPEIEPYFDINPDGIRLRPCEWFKVQTVSAERQGLRHLLDALVAFWGHACVYCGKESGDLHIEHIVPVVRGGTDDLTNLTLSCPTCNLRKHTQTAEEFGFPHIHALAARIQ